MLDRLQGDPKISNTQSIHLWAIARVTAVGGREEPNACLVRACCVAALPRAVQRGSGAPLDSLHAARARRAVGQLAQRAVGQLAQTIDRVSCVHSHGWVRSRRSPSSLPRSLYSP